MIITAGADRPCTDLANPREVREFVESKRRRRELIRATVKAVSASECIPTSSAAARAYLTRLGELPEWGAHLRQLEQLDREFRRLHARALPAPRKLQTNPDVSLTLFFGASSQAIGAPTMSLTIRIYEAGAVAIIGGSRGGVSRNLLAPEVVHALSLL